MTSSRSALVVVSVLATSACGGGAAKHEGAVVVARVEVLGPIPGHRLAIAGTGRLACAGQVSDDGGRSWQPLVDAHGRRLVPLGGELERAPAWSADGQRLLFAEGLLDVPGVPLGLGPIAHALEWGDGGWRPWLEEAPGTVSGMPVQSVAFLGDGSPAAVLADRLVTSGGAEFAFPGRAVAFLATRDGSLYVALNETDRFPLYQRTATGDWEPVPAAPHVRSLAEASDGSVLALAPGQCGRGRAGRWEWQRCSPPALHGQLVTHPTQALTVAWGPSAAGLSRDQGLSWRPLPLPGLTPTWMAFEPSSANALLVLDDRRVLHRIEMAGES